MIRRTARIAQAIVHAQIAKPLPWQGVSRLGLRVGFFEADWRFAHQSMAPLYLECGRWDLAVRLGLSRFMLKHRCAGILGGQRIEYLRPLPRLRRFEVRTQVATWDEKWLYLVQEITSADKVYVSASVRVLFVGKGRRKVPPREVLDWLGATGSTPPYHEVSTWPELERIKIGQAL